MTVDPKITFIIGLVATVASVASGPDLWAHAVPDNWVPVIAAWNGIGSKIGLALMTFLTGVSSSQSGTISKLINGDK